MELLEERRDNHINISYISLRFKPQYITIASWLGPKKKKKKEMAPRQTVLPLIYRVFFLIIEPISALIGAFYANFRQEAYLRMTTHAATAAIPLGTSIVLSQLANLYLLFALNEALVLRCTGDITVWKTVLFVLLLADFGHLYSVSAHGSWIYWDFMRWNAIDWGNVAFVYLGLSMRIAFLSGIGLVGGGGGQSRTKSSKTTA